VEKPIVTTLKKEKALIFDWPCVLLLELVGPKIVLKQFFKITHKNWQETKPTILPQSDKNNPKLIQTFLKRLLEHNHSCVPHILSFAFQHSIVELPCSFVSQNFYTACITAWKAQTKLSKLTLL